MCLGDNDNGGPCRCPADTRARAQEAAEAAAAADREVAQLRKQLDLLPDTLDTLLSKRPDLAFTIRKLHDAGFDMTVSSSMRDSDNKPMLIVGDRHRDAVAARTAEHESDGTADQSPNSPAQRRTSSRSAPSRATSGPARNPSSASTKPAAAAGHSSRYPDPTTYRRNSPEGRLQRQIDRNGGTWTFMALFDVHGKPVPARRVATPYGIKWAVYDNAQLRGKASRWVKVSDGSPQTRIDNLERLGYRLGEVRVKAQAVPIGEGRRRDAEIVRLDNGFDPNAEIVSNFVVEFYGH